jgi:glycosyltransferase involved in cell wall biosynthesis
VENLLTIVIPEKNEGHFIGSLLTSLLGQTYVTRDTPVIIADAESTDGTLGVIDQYKDRLNITVVRGGIPSVGRDNGARLAKTKYLLFVDADIEMGEEDTIEKCIALAESKALDLVTTNISIKDGNWGDRLFWWVHGWVSRFKILGAFATGMFIFMRTERFVEIGGFDESIALGEDWELTHNVLRRKFCLCDSFVLTTNRRFKLQGYPLTIWEYLMVASSKRYRHKGHESYFHTKF